MSEVPLYGGRGLFLMSELPLSCRVGARVYRVGEEHDQAVDPNTQPCVQHSAFQVNYLAEM